MISCAIGLIVTTRGRKKKQHTHNIKNDDDNENMKTR